MANQSEKIGQPNQQVRDNPSDSLSSGRRGFLKAGATLGAALLAAPAFPDALAGPMAIPEENRKTVQASDHLLQPLAPQVQRPAHWPGATGS
jgi:hypothetical protein